MSPDGSPVFGAALLSQRFLPVLGGSDRTARTTDRWQLSVSRREKEEEPIVVMIFFSSHLLFPTPRTNTNLYYILLFRFVLEKKEKGAFLCPFFSFFFLAQIIRIILGRKHFDRTFVEDFIRE